MNLLRTWGRAGPKSQLEPDGPSMRASCSGTQHQRAGLTRTSADFKGNGHPGSLVEIGAEVLQVCEFELALAHLRVPEMA